MQRKRHREYRSERGHYYSFLRKMVTSMLVESGTPDSATSLLSGHLCIERVRKYHNIGGNEDNSQQSAIFKGSGDSEPDSVVKQGSGSKDSRVKNIYFNVPSAHAGLP